MKLDFNKIEEVSHMEFKGGKKCLMARMYTDGMTKIMKDRLEPGASIGMHTHETDCEIIYILSGNGTVLYDDGEESLEPEGTCTQPYEYRNGRAGIFCGCATTVEADMAGIKFRVTKFKKSCRIDKR